MRYTNPSDIERRSFELISGELSQRGITPDPVNADIVLRVIHTTADFDYAEQLVFSDGAVPRIREQFRQGCAIVTDTRMAQAGIGKGRLARYGIHVLCHMSDPDVAYRAAELGITRAAVSMRKAFEESGDHPHPMLFAVGNAPTALMELTKLIRDDGFRPAGVIAVPVGFVNVVEAKEEILDTAKEAGIPCIAARGRKGGSTVAAAICNALLLGLKP